MINTTVIASQYRWAEETVTVGVFFLALDEESLLSTYKLSAVDLSWFYSHAIPLTDFPEHAKDLI